MRKIVTTLLMIVTLLLIAVAAMAVDAPAAIVPAPTNFSLLMSQTLLPALAALALGILTRFLNQLGAKYKIESLTQTDGFLQSLAAQGIAKAEELAATYVNSKAALSGTDKLSIAVNYIIGVMPKVTPEQATSLVHAMLAKIPGVGATGDTAVVVATGPSLIAGTAILTPPDPAEAGAST